MTARVVPASFGMHELVALYQRYATRALAIAIVLHGLAIAAYWFVSSFTKDEEWHGPVVYIPFDRLLPPSILGSEPTVQVGVSEPLTRPKVGVPVPVPDADVNPEQDFPTQRDLSTLRTPGVGDGNGKSVILPPEPKEETEPDSTEFKPVEKLPVPVKIIQPEYPALALRTGMEGTVIVKALVDKEGKVRRVIILKGDADFFNDAAMKAASQWVFTPALMNSGPVMVWISIPFRFRLNR